MVVVVSVVGLVAFERIANHLDRSDTREAIDNVDRLVRASALYLSLIHI